jgi:hypothetical protein
LLAGDDITPNEQTTVYMAAHGCHFIVCSLCVLLVNIKILSFTLSALVQRKLFCISQDHWPCQVF